ncbi:hypothetical protein [Streptococcus suis]|uniref:hypothetical protein n=1 Tax=Streptococcus suis TaxID=1307 RepID=UPI000CF3AB44|nr:hypothetical protein [Streptococcus suis]
MTEQKKLGRPTSDPKDYQMRIRLSNSHKEKLDEIELATGKNKSDIIREGIDLVYQNTTK